MASQLVFLDSRHSERPDTPHDTLYTLNFVQAADVAGFSLSIESASFPNAVYPIQATYANVYFKEDGGATITATLDTNNYTGTEIATELAAQLDAASAAFGLIRTYTVSYDAQAKKLSIAPSAGTVQLVAGANDAYDELGFSVPTSAAASITADYPIRLDGTQYVDLVSSIGQLNYSSNGRTDVLARVPVLGGFGTVVYYENDSDDMIDLVHDDINDVEIRLLDDRGRPWVLPANANVSIVLKLTRTL